MVIWRGARAADRAGLENRCGRKSTEGSNPSLSAYFCVGAMLLLSTFSSKKLEKPHFPRNPGFTYIVLTMRLQGHACPQFAPKNFGAEEVWTTALPLKKNPCDLFELSVQRLKMYATITSFADQGPLYVLAIRIPFGHHSGQPCKKMLGWLIHRSIGCFEACCGGDCSPRI